WSGCYMKYTALSADDWPTLGVACFVKKQEGVIEDVRLTLGAAVDTPTRLTEAEQLLRSKELTRSLLDEVGEVAGASVDPSDDLRGSEWYKREMIRVHVRRALQVASGGLQL